MYGNHKLYANWISRYKTLCNEIMQNEVYTKNRKQTGNDFVMLLFYVFLQCSYVVTHKRKKPQKYKNKIRCIDIIPNY